MQTSLITRDDTFFGVCEGLGQDLGVPSNLLRIAFGGALLVSPLAAIGAYAMGGVVVAASRWLHPAPPTPAPTVDADAVLNADNDSHGVEFARAA